MRFRLRRNAKLTFLVSHKWCGGPGCYKVVAQRTVPAGKGANRLVLSDLRKALPAGRYRLEIRKAGTSQALVRKSLTIPRS